MLNRKFLAIITSLALAFSFAACAAESDTAVSGTEENKSSSANLPDAVTLDEVNKLIAAARVTYETNDKITLSDGAELISSGKKADLTPDAVMKMDADDETLVAYRSNVYGVGEIVHDMLVERFPDNAVKLMPKETTTNFPYPDYFFMDLASGGFSDANDAVLEFMKDDNTDFDGVGDVIYVSGCNVWYYNAETDEHTQLYPAADEIAVLDAIMDLEAGVATGELE